MSKTIDVPDWAVIGKYVLIRDYNLVRGDDEKAWYKEKIIAFGYDGIFTQAYACPMYYYPFCSYGNIIKEVGDNSVSPLW